MRYVDRAVSVDVRTLESRQKKERKQKKVVSGTITGNSYKKKVTAVLRLSRVGTESGESLAGGAADGNERRHRRKQRR